MLRDSPIVVDGLNHAFGKGALRKQILFDISTEIPAGEIVIVTGPSGSGKTTLLTIVGALRSAQSGSVRVLGEELCGARPRTLERVRGQIGFIFQLGNGDTFFAPFDNTKNTVQHGCTFSWNCSSGFGFFGRLSRYSRA